LAKTEIYISVANGQNLLGRLLNTKRIFLISSRKPDLGEMSDQMTYVEENIAGLKVHALLFSLHCITKTIVERKYEMLKVLAIVFLVIYIYVDL
jgi:hypothetical protein